MSECSRIVVRREVNLTACGEWRFGHFSGICMELMVPFESQVGKSSVHTFSYLSDFYWTVFLIFWKLLSACVQFFK